MDCAKRGDDPQITQISQMGLLQKEVFLTQGRKVAKYIVKKDFASFRFSALARDRFNLVGSVMVGDEVKQRP
jgi:hypothetical protein